MRKEENIYKQNSNRAKIYYLYISFELIIYFRFIRFEHVLWEHSLAKSTRTKWSHLWKDHKLLVKVQPNLSLPAESFSFILENRRTFETLESVEDCSFVASKSTESGKSSGSSKENPRRPEKLSILLVRSV